MRRAHFLMPWTVAAAFAAFPVSPLAAEVIVHDNSDGTFVWQAEYVQFPSPHTYLDITLPPTQSGAATNLGIKKAVYEGSGWPPPDVDAGYFVMGPGVQIAHLDWVISLNHPFLGDFGLSNPPRPFAPTQAIHESVSSWASPFCTYHHGWLHPLTHFATIGVRLTLPDGVHFGWIRIERAEGAYKPLAWAYETRPDVPIVVGGLGGTPDADGILHVPEEYPAIRTAMNHAAPGQQVVLADGVYSGFDNEMVDFYGKAVTLRSANGPSKCILESIKIPNLGHRGVEFHSGEGRDSVLQGLTVRGFRVHDPETGAGISVTNASSPTISGCILRGNVAEVDDFGAYQTNGGAIAATAGSDPLIVNCLLRSNIAWKGAAVYATQATIVNSTIVKNSSILFETTVYGELGGAAPTLTNCLVFDNAGGPYVLSPNVTATYSCIEGGWPGIGNIASDPQFVDASIGDYRLAAGSPCIDAASNPAVPRGVSEDLDGNPRFQDDPATIDTGLGRAPIVDMGAFEFQPPLDPADLDGDGDVDGFDLALLLGQWTGAMSYAPCPPHAPTDLNADCKINGFDLALLLGAWTGG